MDTLGLHHGEELIGDAESGAATVATVAIRAKKACKGIDR